jgi:diguanylate cyclase (GGDEF)-like protein/PAS domain S-box-containing protein
VHAGARGDVLKTHLARVPAAGRWEVAESRQRARRPQLEERYQAVRDVALEAARLYDAVGLADFAIAKVRELLDVDDAWLCWWSEKRGALELLASSDSDAARIEMRRSDHGASTLAFEQRAPVAIDADPSWSSRDGRAAGSVIAVPALVGDRALGTLAARSAAGRTFTEDEGDALQVLASQVAPAIEVSRLVTALRASEQRFATAFRRNPVGIIATRLGDNAVLDVNDSMLDLIGYRREELLGIPADRLGLIGSGHRQELAAALEQHRAGRGVELQIRGRGGDVRDVIVYSEPLVLDEEPAILASVVDITARRSAERMLRYRSLHDELTGLPNRAYLYERLHDEIDRSADGSRRFALMFVDLDNFSAANDSLGHHGADLLLTQVARRLRERIPSDQLLAHSGGDEFAVMLVGDGAGAAAPVAHDILGVLDSPFPVGEREILVGASIGIASYPQHARTADDLMKCATVALQEAKSVGCTSSVYEGEPREIPVIAFELLGELRGALARGELLLAYQPQVEVRSGRLVGAEALVRWQHPRHGLLGPQSFLPMAERTSLMAPLLAWVMRTALRETRASGVPVAVNLAMRNLLEPGLAALVRAALDDADRPPAALTLEITEGGVMRNPVLAIGVLDELRAMGCRLSIDDFGTGYSSLAYLQRLPVHEVKIDRSFVSGLPGDGRSLSIVQASIALAHGLGLVVVAEGVEDRRSLDALRRMECDRAQGFLLGKPLPGGALNAAP